MDARWGTCDSPFGAFGVLEDSEGRVIAAGFSARPSAFASRVSADIWPSRIITSSVFRSLEVARRYFDGEQHALDEVVVRQSGGAFLQRCWAAMRAIGPGASVSYSELAESLGSPSASRAVGSACAKNVAALFVPCHRIVRRDGSLGGYLWGLATKERLLQFEHSGSTSALL